MTAINDERIAEIRARREAATPGPWVYSAEMRPWSEFVHFQIATRDPHPDNPNSPRFIAWMNGGRDCAPSVFTRLDRNQKDKLVDEGVRDIERCEPDASFIAHAPDDIDTLLAEVDLQRAEIAELTSAYDIVMTECWRQGEEIERLNKERTVLTALAMAVRDNIRDGSHDLQRDAETINAVLDSLHAGDVTAARGELRSRLSRTSEEDGVSLIAAERKRQDNSRDDVWDGGELADSALLMLDAARDSRVDFTGRPLDCAWKLAKRPYGTIRFLALAGAFIAAEIDRLQRASRSSVSERPDA